jgi:hypothetical protein
MSAVEHSRIPTLPTLPHFLVIYSAPQVQYKKLKRIYFSFLSRTRRGPVRVFITIECNLKLLCDRQTSESSMHCCSENGCRGTACFGLAFGCTPRGPGPASFPLRPCGQQGSRAICGRQIVSSHYGNVRNGPSCGPPAGDKLPLRILGRGAALSGSGAWDAF